MPDLGKKIATEVTESSEDKKEEDRIGKILVGIEKATTPISLCSL